MSLRFVWAAAAACYCLLVFATAAVLVASTHSLHRSTLDLERDSQGVEAVGQMETNLLQYQRISNFVVATGGAEYHRLRARLREQLERRLAEAEHLTNSQTEDALLAEARRHIAVYIREREALEATGEALGPVLIQMRPRMEAALGGLEQLRQINRSDMERSMVQAERMNRLANMVGIVIAFLVTAAAIVLTWSARRYIFRPLQGIAGAIDRFHGGDTTARADERAPKELRHLARTFNLLAAQLGRQRQNRLDFLGGVVHDLRNPLAAIQLSIQSLGRRLGGDERAQRTLALVDRQLHRLDCMLTDLLDASRIESGQLELRIERVDLRQAAQEVVNLYGSMSNKHEIVLSVPRDPVLTSADPTRISQVLGNLLSNAIKYSPEGGRIEVAVDCVGGRAMLSVADEGLGIAPEELGDIFVPFRRAASSHDTIPGTGLGLSVVRRIVRAHGGELEVSSALRRGSTFRVWLPCDEKTCLQEGRSCERQCAPESEPLPA